MKTEVNFNNLYQVQELNNEEMANINGGGIITGLLLGLLVSAIVDAIDNPDEFQKGAAAAARK